MTEQTWYVDISDAGSRLDSYLSEMFPEHSRSYWQKLIQGQQVWVNGKTQKNNFRLIGGEEVSVQIPEATSPDICPQPIPLDILYEDNDLIFVNKPKGMVVHPAPGHEDGTLVNALLFHCGETLSGINGIQRPGIVHRIDRDTTGVLVVCKNDFAHHHVAAQLARHSITRRYEAVVWGNLPEEGTIDAPIGRCQTNRLKMAVVPAHGKSAVTHYRTLEHFDKCTHVECQLETGRTHQIRVHMDSIHHPLLGDPLYGRIKCPFSLEGQALHARVLGLIHPRTGEYLECEATLPDYFVDLLRNCRNW